MKTNNKSLNEYIIVDTFNGEGYSDSEHHVILASDLKQVQTYCKTMAFEEFSSEYGEDKESHEYQFSGWYSYRIFEDHGAVHYVKRGKAKPTQAKALYINPCVNEFQLLMTDEEVNETIDMIKKYSCEIADGLGEEDAPIWEYLHHEALEGDGDIKLEKIQKPSKVLTWNDDELIITNL